MDRNLDSNPMGEVQYESDPMVTIRSPSAGDTPSDKNFVVESEPMLSVRTSNDQRDRSNAS